MSTSNEIKNKINNHIKDLNPEFHKIWMSAENQQFLNLNLAVEKKKKTKPLIKKPLSSYILFSTSIRDTIKQENPTFTQQEIMKEMANKWKDLDEEKKLEYKNIFAERKKQYVLDLENLQKTEPTLTTPSRKSSRTKGSGTAPSEYVLFCREKRKEYNQSNQSNPTISGKNMIKLINEEWATFRNAKIKLNPQ